MIAMSLLRRWRWLRVRSQCSVRFLLVLVMISGICCGIFTEWWRRTIRQRKAVATVCSYGGSVGYDFQLQVYETADDFVVRDPPVLGESRCPTFLTNSLGIDALEAVGEANIHVEYPRSDLLASLKDLPALKRLTVAGRRVNVPFMPAFTAEMIAQIADCKSVECLSLSGTLPPELEPIARMPKLVAIELRNSNIDDESFCKMLPPQVRTLRLKGGTAISDSALRFISQTASLRTLEISNEFITDQGMEYLGTQTQLRELFLDLPQLSDASLSHIAKLNDLRKFTLLNHHITDDGVRKLASLPGLTELVLSARRNLLDLVRPSETGPYLKVTVASLSKLSSLRHLTLLDIEMDRDQIVILRCLTDLQSLDIDSPLLTDSDWQKLTNAFAPAVVRPSAVFFK